MNNQLTRYEGDVPALVQGIRRGITDTTDPYDYWFKWLVDMFDGTYVEVSNVLIKPNPNWSEDLLLTAVTQEAINKWRYKNERRI